MDARVAGLVVACCWVGVACGHDWSAGSNDAGAVEAEAADGEAVEPDAADADVDAVVDDAGADADADADAAADADAVVDDAGADADADADVPPPDVPPGCGNGVVEPGEACDDGNSVTEWCGGDAWEACLSDCSLRLGNCGNGMVESGEACDDGNESSFDDCTTSCTRNDQGFGAPCRCVSGCDSYDLSAGTFEGCEGMREPSGASARAVCRRSVRGLVLPVESHAAEGYCTWMAVGCEGTSVYCSLVPQYGNVDSFDCPADLVERTTSGEYMGATLTAKHCALPCSSQRDCRWHAVEDPSSPWAGECGQWTCITEAGGVESFCEDARNLD